ncbi:hypothetical protein LCGC14_1888760 [marine sediment metagenome]|uniref:Uncharacterized protein n=1 Tax=marine sediment metagenome TaxID=412755 RepID=A0A0F9GNC3_9ZZZZ
MIGRSLARIEVRDTIRDAILQKIIEESEQTPPTKARLTQEDRMSTSATGQKKRRRKREHKRLLREKVLSQRRDAFRRFPRIVYRHEGVPARLVDAVKAAVKKFVFDHETILPPAAVRLFHLVRKIGFQRTLYLGKTCPELNSGLPNRFVGLSPTATTLLCSMGDYILSQLPSSTIDGYLPFSDISTLPGQPHDTSFLVEMRSLCTAKTAHGTAYFSPYKPTLEIGGHRLIVAFSDHAVRRICERTVREWKVYPNQVYAFSVLYETTYFEPWIPRDGKIGFTLFHKCLPVNREYANAQELVGKLPPGRTHSYRMGYCPAEMDRGFLRAKTLLLPGMVGTPEYNRCLRPLAKSPEKRTEFYQRGDNLTCSRVYDQQDLDLLKYFHNSGIPQVVSFDHEISRCKLRPPSKRTQPQFQDASCCR